MADELKLQMFTRAETTSPLSTQRTSFLVSQNLGGRKRRRYDNQ